MTHASKLRTVNSADKNVPRPMPKDPFEEVLDALAGHSTAGREPSIDELDRIYSQAVSEGRVSEETLKASFARFAAQLPAGRDEVRPSLSPAAVSVGSEFRAFCIRRTLTPTQVARQYNLSLEQLKTIEESEEPFRPDQLAEVAKVVASRAGIPIARLHTLLQAVRATLHLKSAVGPKLMAARKVPPK